jgi:hypothetical protein
MAKKSSEQVTQIYNFASLYDLDPASRKRVTHFHTTSEFESKASNLLAHATHGQLLFMRGHPSPE